MPGIVVITVFVFLNSATIFFQFFRLFFEERDLFDQLSGLERKASRKKLTPKEFEVVFSI